MQNLQQYNELVAKLTSEVEAQTTIFDSAIALIQGLKAQINDLITRTDGIVDLGQLQNLSTAIDVGTKKLADAVAANTTPAPAVVNTPPALETAAGEPANGATGQDPNAPAS